MKTKHAEADPGRHGGGSLRRAVPAGGGVRHHLRTHSGALSEALCLLPFLFPETAWGLGVGCLIANLFSPYGVLDIVVGSLATLIAALITSRCRNVWLAALPPVACNMVLVGAVLAYEQAGTSAAFWPAYGLNAATVGAGEAIACLVLGVLLVKQLPRIPYFRDRLQSR